MREDAVVGRKWCGEDVVRGGRGAGRNRCGEDAVRGGRGTGETQCGEDAMRGRCDAGETHCGGVAMRGSCSAREIAERGGVAEWGSPSVGKLQHRKAWCVAVAMWGRRYVWRSWWLLNHNSLCFRRFSSFLRTLQRLFQKFTAAKLFASAHLTMAH